MTKENLITVNEGVDLNTAKKLLQRHKIERIIVVNDDYHCVGLVTVKDMEKSQAFPLSCKDEDGHLRVGAASTVGDDGFKRTEALIDAGADVVVIDTAHGHSQLVLDSVTKAKKLSNKTKIIAGNVATYDGAKALIDAVSYTHLDVYKRQPFNSMV